jgi:nitroimidazol reductase NimA-like FMN-containing flavoprotein (pyridoxamine 5'-phosphate oxidase superfamily)
MRRSDREITDSAEIIKVIDRCKVCRIALSVHDQPYIVPLNFGYIYENDALTLYFHSAPSGKKLDMLKENNKVCLEMDCDHSLIESDSPCGFGFNFSSIIGFGTIHFMQTDEEKLFGLNALMRHQTGKNIQYTFEKNMLSQVIVYKLIVTSFSGKRK